MKCLVGMLSSLASQLSTDPSSGTESITTVTGRKGIKRARAYEGGEIFGIGKGVLLRTRDEANWVIEILEGECTLASCYC